MSTPGNVLLWLNFILSQPAKQDNTFIMQDFIAQEVVFNIPFGDLRQGKQIIIRCRYKNKI